jgi:hypothetical protein
MAGNVLYYGDKLDMLHRHSSHRTPVFASDSP